VADISKEGVQETARLIEELGSLALAVTCDVRMADDVKTAMDQAVTAFGCIDVAFNAGVEQPHGAIADVTEQLNGTAVNWLGRSPKSSTGS
jgi:NAD(P)-dependent dehydrogenase (short-subunit alcohol dehydrogenase family)